MTEDAFKALCNTFGFAPSRALREMLDKAMEQEREACAAPPQRKPLTKESLLHIYNQLPNWGMDMDSLPQGLEKFARAVERAHSIK